MLVARKASCHDANAFWTRVKLIWPIFSLKISKMSKKGVFGLKSAEGKKLIKGRKGLARDMRAVLCEKEM